MTTRLPETSWPKDYFFLEHSPLVPRNPPQPRAPRELSALFSGREAPQRRPAQPDFQAHFASARKPISLYRRQSQTALCFAGNGQPPSVGPRGSKLIYAFYASFLHDFFVFSACSIAPPSTKKLPPRSGSSIDYCNEMRRPEGGASSWSYSSVSMMP